MQKWFNEFSQVVEKNRQNPSLRFMTPESLNNEFLATPYLFDPTMPIRTYAEVKSDGDAACAEAAAAIGAVLLNAGQSFDLCIKKDLTNATHATIITNGVTFDPYGKYFTRGINACYKKPQFLSIR